MRAKKKKYPCLSISTYENVWAVLMRTDQGIFPQSIPVAKSSDKVPRDGVKNEIAFYDFPVALFSDDEEFADRLPKTKLLV